MPFKDPKDRRDFQLKKYHRRREMAIKDLGGACSKCGSKKELQLDHKRPSQKSFPIGRALASWSEERVQKELKKCQVLCRDCHEKKSIKESGKKVAKDRHGTLSSYRYCRCARCRKAKSEANQEYRLRGRP